MKKGRIREIRERVPLASVPSVKIEGDICKFVLLTAKEFGKDESCYLFVRADENCSHHGMIVNKFRNELAMMRLCSVVNCLGGGEISVKSQDKKIRIWGESHAYGIEPDRGATLDILKQSYTDWDICAVD